MASTLRHRPARPALGPLTTVRLPDPPHGTSVLPVCYDTVFTWSYAAERVDLRNLYEKSKDAMWNARTDLAWDDRRRPRGARRARRDEPDLRHAASGTSSTRRPSSRSCAATTGRGCSRTSSTASRARCSRPRRSSAAVPGADAKLYAAAQVIDEARHVEAYDRYLREKIELHLPDLAAPQDAARHDPRATRAGT